MLNLIPIGFATLMALMDAGVLSLFKSYNIGSIQWRAIVPIGMLLYSIQPLIFLESLKYESMTIMNILWDVISDISVTLIGLFYFKERISLIKMIGLFFAFIAITLLSYDSINNS